MIRRPPRSTRTDTLFPYSTLFRSAQFLVARLEPASRGVAGQRLDPADTRRYRAFVHDLEQADVARRGDMRAAAQLQTVDRRVIAAGAPHRDDAHFIAVLDRKRTRLNSSH